MNDAHNATKCHTEMHGQEGTEDRWAIVSQHFDKMAQRRVVGWALLAAGRDRAELAEINGLGGAEYRRRLSQFRLRHPATRTISASTSGSLLRVSPAGDFAEVDFHLPATLVTTSRDGMVVTVELDIDGDRVVTERVEVTRGTRSSVGAAALHGLAIGELVDFACTRSPIVEHSGGGGFLGPGHPAAGEALRAAVGRRGKRGERVQTVDDVAKVANAAPPRKLVKSLEAAFPGTGRRTLMRVLAEARELGLVKPSTR
ncbi:MAG TPA: hypothetical protein PK020_17255 [Ilumatobacteraceae bacterium]|nr:hypothetical protein [Ilumatobacteraceae bacterium]HRB03094.1 hypothetical protein [Ilumatobacteraceae bacterium]